MLDGSFIKRQEAVLAEVREMGPVTTAAVAKGVGVSWRAASAALAALERRGLVEWANYQRTARVWLPADEQDDKPVIIRGVGERE